jgi:hypothetical protein
MLSDRLPESYLGNLALLPKEQREAIQEDKQRWLDAHNRYKQQTSAQIRQWLKNLPEGEYKDDMRRRLNIIRSNHASRSNAG